MRDYPSEITKEQFKHCLIRAELENVKKATKPRKLDLYDVFCAVLYILKGGIQWRMLASDFPNWQSVYFYFPIWSKKEDGKESVLESVLKNCKNSQELR